MGKHRSTVDIIFEKIPPALTWIAILLPIWGGFLIPEITAYFVVLFNVLFLYKSISSTTYFIISYIRIRENEEINWLHRLQELTDLNEAIAAVQQRFEDLKQIKPVEKLKPSNYLSAIAQRFPDWIKNIFEEREKNKIKQFLKKEYTRLDELKKLETIGNWQEINHIIIIPHWKEPETVLRDTLTRISKTNYPTKKISVVLGAEARDPDGYQKSIRLQKEFANTFGNIWVSNHELTENEIIGKSSNMAFAGKYLMSQIKKLNWDTKKIIITSCDADSQLPSNYFGEITYRFITETDSEYKFFTGAMVLYANIWRLPFYARVKNSMSTIYNVGRLARTDKLIPFSTYSASLWLIHESGYWTPYVTPEDFHMFFKAHLRFPSKVSTIPIFQRIMADAAEGDTHLDTIKNNYFQERRWSWGISDDGWLLKEMIKKFFKGELTITLLYRGLHTMVDHILGPVTSMIVLIGGNIPLAVNSQFAHTVIGVNLPGISSFIIQITIWFFFIAIIVDQYLKPTKPGKRNLFQKLFYFVEWLIQPIVGTILIALPGLEAHTRLLFGRYLEYYLTKKKD